MRKLMLLAVAMLILIAACAANAYAIDKPVSPWADFWDPVGGFLWNLMPWNWSNWAGK